MLMSWCTDGRRPGSACAADAKENSGAGNRSPSPCSPGTERLCTRGAEQGGGRWTKRRDFGRVPAYLLAIKLRLAQQQAAQQARFCGQGMSGAEPLIASCLYAQSG